MVPWGSRGAVWKPLDFHRGGALYLYDLRRLCVVAVVVVMSSDDLLCGTRDLLGKAFDVLRRRWWQGNECDARGGVCDYAIGQQAMEVDVEV